MIPEQIGFWVPGMRSLLFRRGTGIRVEPGSMIIAQMHYNTVSSAPVADQSVIEIATTDSVEKRLQSCKPSTLDGLQMDSSEANQ